MSDILGVQKLGQKCGLYAYSYTYSVLYELRVPAKAPQERRNTAGHALVCSRNCRVPCRQVHPVRDLGEMS
jgi:hypothetical protein